MSVKAGPVGRIVRENIMIKIIMKEQRAKIGRTTYIVHIYKIRSLSRVVKKSIILLDKTLADRLVRHIHRHDAENWCPGLINSR